jgi:hypothetical protein
MLKWGYFFVGRNDIIKYNSIYSSNIDKGTYSY